MSTPSSTEASRTLGADLLSNSYQFHNHGRPETADAAVMAKAAAAANSAGTGNATIGASKRGSRPMSAQASYQKSVEEELELTSRSYTGPVNKSSHLTVDHQSSRPRAKGLRGLKTNNFFLPSSVKWTRSNKTAASNSLATSPVIFGGSQNGSPRTSPAQSVLTLPNDPPSNSTICDLGGGVSEIASIQNGKKSFFNTLLKEIFPSELLSILNDCSLYFSSRSCCKVLLKSSTDRVNINMSPKYFITLK